MKYFLLFLMLTVLFGCAKPNTHDAELADLQAQVEELRTLQVSTDETIKQLLGRIEFEATLIEELQNKLNTEIALNQSSAEQIADLQNSIAELQSQLDEDAERVKKHGRVKGNKK